MSVTTTPGATTCLALIHAHVRVATRERMANRAPVISNFQGRRNYLRSFVISNNNIINDRLAIAKFVSAFGVL